MRVQPDPRAIEKNVSIATLDSELVELKEESALNHRKNEDEASSDAPPEMIIAPGFDFSACFMKMNRIFFGTTKVRVIQTKPAFEDIERLGIIHYIPGFNIVYNMIFEVSPLPEHALRVLHMMGLISALLTSVIAGIMTYVGISLLPQIVWQTNHRLRLRITKCSAH